MGGKIQPLLAPSHDDYLLRRNDHAARRASRKPVINWRSSGRSGGIHVFAHANRRPAQAIEGQPTPDSLRKGLGIRTPQREIVEEVAMIRRMESQRTTAGIRQGQIDDTMVT